MTVAGHTIPLHHRKYGAKDPKRRLVGWAVVVLVHAVVLWALIAGTAHDALQSLKKPMQAAVIQEVIIPPTPPAPPQPREVKPALPKQQPKLPPPPTFVPPPEVAAPPTAAAMPSVPTSPAPPVAAPPPAPAAPAESRQEIGEACPRQVTPKTPRQAVKEGIEGVVRAQATIRGGKVVEVTILSGPRIFHEAVRSAMLQYGCTSTAGDIVATQEFAFKFN